jgi:hypothetical protein
MIKLERLAPSPGIFAGRCYGNPQVTAELRKPCRDVGLRGFRSPFAYGTSCDRDGELMIQKARRPTTDESAESERRPGDGERSIACAE